MQIHNINMTCPRHYSNTFSAMAMHVHLASMISCQILAFESLFTGLLSLYSCPWNPPLRIPVVPHKAVAEVSK